MEASLCNLNTVIAFRPSLLAKLYLSDVHFCPPKHGFKSAKLFCRSFLKPITSAPTQETCDLTSLFDLEGRLCVQTKREETWGKPCLAVTCGMVTRDNMASCLLFVPSNGPTSQCEMRLACHQALSIQQKTTRDADRRFYQWTSTQIQLLY